jgi:hypothetical protein
MQIRRSVPSVAQPGSAVALPISCMLKKKCGESNIGRYRLVSQYPIADRPRSITTSDALQGWSDTKSICRTC